MKKIILLFAGLTFLTIKNQAQIVTDTDGNVYNTVTIGTQVWMKENLKVSHYLNGDAIPIVTDVTIWGNLTTDAMCYYDNDSTLNAPVYGALYNWHAVNDSRELCPTGWHIPSDNEWNILEKYLDSDVDTSVLNTWTGTKIGNILKETGTSHWTIGNSGTDSVGFTALPGGYRDGSAAFHNINIYGAWWTSTVYDAVTAWYRYLHYNKATVLRNHYSKKNGFSVRCVKDYISTQINDRSIEKAFQIYPNPAINNLTIESLHKSTVEILNIQGQTILQKQIQQGKTNIDINRLAKGLYFLKVNSDGKTEGTSFVKE